MRGAGGRERNVGGTDGVIEESGIDTTRPNRVKMLGRMLRFAFLRYLTRSVTEFSHGRVTLIKKSAVGKMEIGERVFLFLKDLRIVR